MLPRRMSIDNKPGPLPEIHANGESMTFAFEIDEIEAGLRLVIRCDAAGGLWGSIELRKADL